MLGAAGELLLENATTPLIARTATTNRAPAIIHARHLLFALTPNVLPAGVRAEFLLVIVAFYLSLAAPWILEVSSWQRQKQRKSDPPCLAPKNARTFTIFLSQFNSQNRLEKCALHHLPSCGVTNRELAPKCPLWPIRTDPERCSAVLADRQTERAHRFVRKVPHHRAFDHRVDRSIEQGCQQLRNEQIGRA